MYWLNVNAQTLGKTLPFANGTEYRFPAVNTLRDGKRKFHHLVEGILSLFGIQFFARQQVVGNGTDTQGVFACARGVRVQSRRFHFYCQYAQFAPHRSRLCVVVKVSLLSTLPTL